MPSELTFSIITPSYKQLNWLRLCVASVRDQVAVTSLGSTGGLRIKVEHIIQDNCTPGIDDLAQELGAEFHVNGRLAFHSRRVVNEKACTEHYCLRIYSEADDGMYDAVNRGFRRAQGDFLAYLNADDQYLYSSLVKVAVHFSEHPHVDMAFGNVVIVNQCGEYLCTRIVSTPSELVTGLHTLSIFTAATFFRRSCLTNSNLYFDSSWKVIGDAIWILSHLRAGTKMNLIGEKLAAATETGKNMILSPLARHESAKLRSKYSKSTRLLRSFVVVWYRLRRLLQGVYFPKPFSYAVYTHDDTSKRKLFCVGKATHRLKGRFG